MKKISQLSIIILLLIQLVIGTPFTNSIANEIIDSTPSIDTLEPIENTIGSTPTVETFPVNEVQISEDNTTITYTEEDNISSTGENNAIPENETTTGDTNNNTENTLTSSGDIQFSSGDITINNQTNSTEIVENTSLSTGNLNTNISLITQQPQKSPSILSGLIDPLSIDSFNVIDSNSTITFCSYITYLNLKNIIQLPEDNYLRGNAVDIWSNLTLQSTIENTGEIIFTGTNISGQQFINYLSGIYTTSGSTVFDIITLKPKTQDDQSTGLSLHQSHRFVTFLGTDHQRYVLDPVRILSTDPVLLSGYLKQFIFDHEDIKIAKTYQVVNGTKITFEENKKNTILTGTQDEAHGIVVHSPMEFLPYVLQGLITSTKTGELISNEIIFHTGFRYETISGDLSAYIPAGLIIKTADGNNFNVSALQIQELSGDSTIISGSQYDSTFQFGISGQHLIFSQPISLTIHTTDYQNGDKVNLIVQHEGYDWNILGLTNNYSAICNNDGSVSEENQISNTTVYNNTVQFYTCGASSFALGYVPEVDSPNGNVLVVQEQPDGKIIIGGAFTTVGGVARNYLARLNSDKSLDTSFNSNISITAQVNTIAIQADGKIIIGGTFITVGGVTRNRIARLNSDGSLDTSFNPNANNTINDIEIQSDGKILIGGTFTTIGVTAINRIARLNSDGSLDTSFNPNANNTINDIEIQSDGNILLGGAFTTIGVTARNRIARISSTGFLDTSFNPNANNTINDIEIQSDGSILLGGAFTTIGGVARNRIARVFSTGILDTSFNPNANNTINNIEIQSDGNILLGGAFTSIGGVVRNRIARVSSTGTLDTSFNPNANNTVNDIIVLINNKIIVGGLFTTINGVTQSYISYIDHIVHDTVYNARPNSTVNILLKQSDGKIIIGGAFTTLGGTGRNRIGRLDNDGTLDMSFNPNTNGVVQAGGIQTDGKVIIGGTFTTVGGVTRNYIARLNSDGSLDTSFNANISTTAQLNALAIQTDGKVIIGGTFTTVGGVTRNRIARLNSDGSLDTSFNPNASSNINTIAIQTDGKIIIGGAFTTIGGVARNRIARLNSDGSLDTSFNPNANGTLLATSILSDGKILIGGGFTTIGVTTRNRIARLNSDGSLDTSFNPNANNTVNTFYILPDTSIVVGGLFTTIGGIAKTEIAKIYQSGGIDNGFNITFGAASTSVFTITQDNENNIIAGGSFTTVNAGTNNPYLTRIGTTETLNNIALWLRSDKGTNCITNTCTITSWNDQSSFGRNANVTNAVGGSVIYDLNNQLNFNPTILLNSSQLNLLSPTSLNNFTVFYVLRGTDISQGSALLEDAGTSMRFEQRGNTNKYGFTRYGIADHTSTVTTQWDQYQILRYNSANTTTMDLVVQTPTTKLQQLGWNIGAVSNLGLGRFSSVGNEKGIFNIGEILAYSGQLSSSNLNKIESYLSIKYGFTLDQSVAGGQNYTLSNSLTSRSTGSAGVYNKDIAGLAKDSGMNLSQTKSQTINSTGDIIVESTGVMNMQSIVWGNDGGSTTGWTNSEIPTTGMSSRIAREWKFQEKNGDVGNVSITYPITTGSLPNGTLVLLQDTDGNFSNGGTTIYSGSLSGGIWSFSINIQDNNYITFGILNNGTVCIAGPDSISSGSLTATNSNQTIELQSDYFKVDDQKGSNSGYYTTLSFSALTGSLTGFIPLSAMQIKADSLTTLSGSTNPAVILNASLNSYSSISNPVQFIKRSVGSGANIAGTYGSKIRLKMNIPAYQSIGTYTGTITYTLYEN